MVVLAVGLVLVPGLFQLMLQIFFSIPPAPPHRTHLPVVGDPP
jgi:hypothetical protein